MSGDFGSTSEYGCHDKSPWVSVRRDPEELWAMVTRMSDRFEEAGASWSYAALPWPFRTPLLGAIVGVRLQIDPGHAKQKLSQNRSDADRRRVAEELRKRGECGLADWVLALLDD